MKIGELSKEAGVRVGTIRFYERRKLLRAAPRTSSGYRFYVPQDVEIVKGIKQLQEVGFTLKEIKELIDLHRSAASVATQRAPSRGVQRMIALTQEKIALMEKKRDALRQMQTELSLMLRNLQTSAESACPVASKLAGAKSSRR
jgi:DNA-binding transcriptional MerR regulator